MTSDKPESRKPDHRVTLYIPPEKQRWQELATRLDREGRPGVFDVNGRPNKSAIIQHLITDKLRA